MRTRSRPRLFLTDHGAGEPVLLITGWTISSAVFDPVAELYVPHVRVVGYDHRGAGRSAPWPAPVSIAMLAADAARVLDDRGIASAHVVGLSMGAGVALELAIRLPHRVKTLVLVGGGAGGPTTVRPPLRQAAGAAGAVVSDTVRHRRPWPAAVLFSGSFREEHPDEVAAYMPYFGRHRASPWMSGWQTVAVACFGRRGSLHCVRAPTLVLHGGRDVMAPVANARLLAEGIPNAELHVVPGAGHAVPLEHSEASALMLVDWVRRHAGVEPDPPRRRDVIAERLTRPAALQAGTLRNTRDAATSVVSALGRPRRAS
jgi:pimeloyl-ACP methyl ester carboxylesterase